MTDTHCPCGQNNFYTCLLADTPPGTLQAAHNCLTRIACDFTDPYHMVEEARAHALISVAAKERHSADR